MKAKVVGIIGGNGSMGRWFKPFFETNGLKVVISDLNAGLGVHDLAAVSDVVVISTPIDVACDTAREVGPLLRKDQLLTDVCSLKETILDAMLAHTAASVIGTHPMFGPYSDTIDGQNMILCPERPGDWLPWLETLFTNAGARVTQMKPADHDKHMALAQGLTHMVSISLGKMLKEMQLTPADVWAVSTPIFRLNLELIGRFLAQNHDLYASLIGQNRHVAGTMDQFREAMACGQAAILDGDKSTAIAFMAELKTYFGAFCDKSLATSNRFLKLHAQSKLDPASV
ncbi:MAG: hypothetical protein CSA22_03065 [Deltaproteobacteria bacterium]|nr:MAG: hypothetical protein CSA22_03065 [Deltaproteobacteria bacterium]